MKATDKFAFVGGPVFIVTMIAMAAVAASMHYVSDAFGGAGPHIGLGWIIGIPLIASAMVLAINAYKYHFYGQRTFGLEDTLSTETSQKRRAMHPRIPKKYLADKPEGLILGKSGKQYVRISTDPKSSSYPGILHTLILGGSGSGKTSGPILSTLIPAMSNRVLTPDNLDAYISPDGIPTVDSFLLHLLFTNTSHIKIMCKPA